MKTAYIVQTFTRQGADKKSIIYPDTPIQCASADEAMNRAERMSDKKTGVLALAQEYDADTDEYGKLTVLAQYGEIPPNALGHED